MDVIIIEEGAVTVSVVEVEGTSTIEIQEGGSNVEVITEVVTVELIVNDPSFSPSNGVSSSEAVFAIPRHVTSRYLHHAGVPSNLGGYYIAQPGKIVSLALYCSDLSSGDLLLKKNGVDVIYSINMDNEKDRRISLSLPVVAGDTLQAFVTDSGVLKNPTLIARVEWN